MSMVDVQLANNNNTIESYNLNEFDESSAAENGNQNDSDLIKNYIKHPLEYKWVMWFFKQMKGVEWTENQKLVAVVDTVEDFWSLFNYIKPASRILIGCDYSFFKEGIQPMWEDKANKAGGRWSISLDKRMRSSELDTFWLETLLCLIGEAFSENSSSICGTVVNLRNKGDRLSLWTKSSIDRDANMAIGQIMKSRLGITQEGFLEYQPHESSMTKGGSMVKAIYNI